MEIHGWSKVHHCTRWFYDGTIKNTLQCLTTIQSYIRLQTNEDVSIWTAVTIDKAGTMSNQSPLWFQSGLGRIYAPVQSLAVF